MIINIDPIEPGDAASPNLWNSRFAAITSVVNGNIEAENIKNGSITRELIAAGAITSDKLAIERSIDDRGWAVVDYGGFKTYRKVVQQPGANFQVGGDATLFSIQPPVGVTATVENTTVTRVLMWGATSWDFFYKGDQTTINGNGNIDFSAHIEGTAKIWWKFIVEVIV